MKIYVRAKGAPTVEPSGRYEIVDYVNITIQLDLNSEVVASSNPDKYPGRKKFLEDVEDLILQKDNNILYSKNSNRTRSQSPSIYIVYECPLSDTKAIICTVFLIVSNHRHLESEFEEGYHNFTKSLESTYKSPKSLGFHDYVITVEMEVYDGYHDVLDNISEKIDDIKRSLKYRYRNEL